MAKRFYKALVYLLGPFLGAVSCGKEVVLYGTIGVTYLLDGTVKSSANQQALEGIEVDFDGDVVSTKTDGSWALSARGFCARASSEAGDDGQPGRARLPWTSL